MSNRLGVVFNEKDLSKSQDALSVPAGVMCIYAEQGRTDKATLCRSEGDFLRNYGAPVALMTHGTPTEAYNRGSHVALRMLRSGLPMYIMRAIPSSVAPVKASALFERVAAGSDASASIKAEALGHGEYYNGITVFVKGIETVSRTIVLTGGAEASLEDNALAGTVEISDPAVASDDDDDTTVAFGDTQKTLTGCTLAGSTVIKYESSLAGYVGYSSITATNSCTLKVTYERTTQDHVVRVFVCDDGETDPVNNNYENYLVSLKADGKDEGGNACFIEDVINDASEYIKVTVGASYVAATIPIAVTVANTYGAMASGTEGTFAASDADIKGTATVAGSTGLQVFRDRTKYDFLYAFDAGFDDTVKKELCDICADASRPFAFAYIDPPAAAFISNGNKLNTGNTMVESYVVDYLCNWRMGLGNREFGAIAGSTWGLITDEWNGGRKLWIGPVYEVGQRTIFVDNNMGSWNSVMGPRRGVTSFEKLAINLYNYRDQLNAKQVNPLIIDERGIQMYYGNKTLKSTASAMQQAHARKTRGRMSREIYFSMLNYVAENLVAGTFNDAANDLETIIQGYAEGLESWSVVVAPAASLVNDLNNQILRIKIGLIFNQIAEEVNITTSVMKNGTDLSVAVF